MPIMLKAIKSVNLKYINLEDKALENKKKLADITEQFLPDSI